MDLNQVLMKTNMDTILKFNAKVSSESDAIFVTDILSQITLANSWWEDKTSRTWVIEVLFERENLIQVSQFISKINEAFKISIIDPEIIDLEQRDWLRENQESFPPLEIGQFYIYGSHINDPTPCQLLPLIIDAATAFGSGNHGSTRGCLLALSHLKSTDYAPDSILDMGCGSGVLAMAAAKLWLKSEITASDIDPECVRVTIENCELNDVAHIDVLSGNGFQNEIILSRQPFNLIIANILATVLCDIVADVKNALSKNGTVILSGILDTQKDMVTGVYAQHNLTLVNVIQVDEWVTLIMKSNDL